MTGWILTGLILAAVIALSVVIPRIVHNATHTGLNSTRMPNTQTSDERSYGATDKPEGDPQ